MSSNPIFYMDTTGDPSHSADIEIPNLSNIHHVKNLNDIELPVSFEFSSEARRKRVVVREDQVPMYKFGDVKNLYLDMENLDINSEPKTKGKGKGNNKAKRTDKAPQQVSPTNDNKVNRGTPFQNAPLTIGKKGKGGKTPQGKKGSHPPKVDMRGWGEDYGGWDLKHDPTEFTNVQELSDVDIPPYSWNFNYYGDYDLDCAGDAMDEDNTDLDAALIAALYGPHPDMDTSLSIEEEAYLTEKWDDLEPEDYFNGRLHQRRENADVEAAFKQIYQGYFPAAASNSRGQSHRFPTGSSEPKADHVDKQSKVKKEVTSKRRKKFNVFHHDSRFANLVCGNKRKLLRIPHLTNIEAKWVLHLAQEYYNLSTSIECPNGCYTVVATCSKRSKLPRDPDSHYTFLETSQMYFMNPEMMDTPDISWSEINLGLPDDIGMTKYDHLPKKDRKRPSTTQLRVPAKSQVVGDNAQALGTENVGHKLLSKMGWKPGESLGTTGTGIREPVKAIIRSHRAGLGHG
ncbi:squalene synthetase-like protein [Dispira simplex]|nr:squalene synthetase-like protein [Dispira simplex]